MKKSLKRAVAVSAVCAAGLAGTLTTTTTATADEARKAPAKELTDFGMTALAYGTKVGVGGVDRGDFRVGDNPRMPIEQAETLAYDIIGEDTIAGVIDLRDVPFGGGF